MRNVKKANYRWADVHGDFHLRMPIPVHGAAMRVCKENGLTFRSVVCGLVMEWLKDYMTEEDYASLQGFLENYYPLFKSEEVIDFWERHFGL